MGTSEYYDSEGYRYWWKDPDEVLDYKLDLASGAQAPLFSGETLAGVDVVAEAGLTVGDGVTQVITSAGNVVPPDVAFDNSTVTVWLSGGDISKEYYEVTVRVRTSQQRVLDSTFRIYMKKR